MSTVGRYARIITSDTKQPRIVSENTRFTAYFLCYIYHQAMQLDMSVSDEQVGVTASMCT